MMQVFRAEKRNDLEAVRGDYNPRELVEFLPLQQ